jgi:hypothetical protein
VATNGIYGIKLTRLETLSDNWNGIKQLSCIEFDYSRELDCIIRRGRRGKTCVI